ncbi:L,D-transpeptidase [Streptomyces acidiscabies]|uniref:L,D-transpeptidase n=1 Tax=Streptomyces acidiscabies TaxID=42234 RepID=A0AAP6BCZ4_9ACTN|nr:L,D-transpeptidase [Streptomyces acidiscabies]MBP5938942.1 L,D-transpeptidase [Streptomyces sp. LBUM 1476]MBZ3910069.1 L,D-transpeptidase [Streptomyces acidiscabies]MDX2962456.1 L,D-transpeptidase [Streptomyces acidiscabies]MDX3020369.1 L,D-transpeptidase [Streptomyces acidiscabies]MDX3789837.1 L,D-transpeptidase [Streptomyces acidiscabies]
MPVPALRLPSWVWVTGLTAGAIVGVGFLALEADNGVHPHPTAAASPKPAATPRQSAAPEASTPNTPGLPAKSGTGRRIVYSLSEDRVWLVDADDQSRRTFDVWPGTVDPAPGTYTISVRTPATTGSDGVAVEHVVYFTVKSGINIAFSNAVDGSSPPPAPAGTQTGGIRLHKEDGTALWAFGATETRVRVVE